MHKSFGMNTGRKDNHLEDQDMGRRIIFKYILKDIIGDYLDSNRLA
jgi:hypothetical protein